ncbi:MAG: glycosyltransferase family 2 protein [Thermoplasmatales archaeon]
MSNYISVIITAYNRKEFLLDAIRSVINQTLNRELYEIIVVKNFHDEDIDNYITENKVREINMEGTVGEFLHAAVLESHGNILSFLDDDDLFTKDKLEFVFNAFHRKKITYLHNNCNYIIDNDISQKPRRRYSPIDFNLSSISIKRDIIDLNYMNTMITGPDALMYLFASEYSGRLIDTGKRLTYYRIHNNNTSQKITWFSVYNNQLKEFKHHFTNRKYRIFLKRVEFNIEFGKLRSSNNKLCVNSFLKLMFLSLVFVMPGEILFLVIKFLRDNL